MNPTRPGVSGNGARTEPDARLIEIGLVVVDALSVEVEQDLLRARDQAIGFLRATFATFAWSMPVIRRVVGRDVRAGRVGRVEPTELIDEGASELASRHWDFAVVVTVTDLATRYRAHAVAAASRATNVAVLSLARLGGPLAAPSDPTQAGPSASAVRVAALLVRLLADLNGIEHCEHEEDYTFGVAAPERLERMQQLCASRREALERQLVDVADQRLEEAPGAARFGAVAFAVRALRINADDIAGAVRRARPWEFPLRLGSMTAAVLSVLVVLLLTAEVWDVGARQSPATVAVGSVGAWIGSCVYVLRRHRLLDSRGRDRWTEQGVATNAAMALVVALGLATTYAAVWSAAWLLAVAMFDDEIVRRWTASEHAVPRWLFACFVASIGIVVGALGSTFEGNYLRHVVLVDEEI